MGDCLQYTNDQGNLNVDIIIMSIDYRVAKTDLSPSSVPIYETTFNCDGSESSLHDCQPGLDTAGLTHSSDAYLMCQSSNYTIALTAFALALYLVWIVPTLICKLNTQCTCTYIHVLCIMYMHTRLSGDLV